MPRRWHGWRASATRCGWSSRTAAALHRTPDGDEAFGVAWQQAPAARRRCCDTRSGRVIAGTAAGLEALLAAGQSGFEPNPSASRKLAEEIRAGLEEISAVLRDTPAPARHDPIAL
jgi:hypothetical protein